jgi:hypothetical protein
LVEDDELRAHKLPRVGSSIPCFKTFSPKIEEQTHFDQIRKYDSYSLSEQARGDEVGKIKQFDTKYLVISYSKSNNSQSSSFEG